MANLNKMTVIGRVGTDPEMRYIANGNPVTSFRMAVNHRYNSQDGERQEETEWFTVTAWMRLAETVNQYLSKGQLAYVEGRLHSNTYQGNDGQPRFGNEIIANQVIFLDRAGGGEQGSAEFGGGGSAAVDSREASTPDDLPF
jgi:single-strand DNA-binding protein